MPPSLTTLQCLLPGGCHLSRAGPQVPLGSCKEFPHLITSLFPFFLDCALALYVGSDINSNPCRRPALNLDNFRIVELHPNADPKLFEAVISNGSQQGPVRFRF